MKTKTVYYEEPYKTEIEATVLEIQRSTTGLLSNIILDQTVFFPEGGGQPGDRGEIVGPNGTIKIEYTRTIDGEIIHQGKSIGNMGIGEKVLAKIDWNWRHKYMKIHSAGHLIHDVLMTTVKDLRPIKGSHGQKAWLEYEGTMDIGVKEKLEEKVNETLNKGLPIITKEANYDELVKECSFLPPNLPKDKPLRMIKIGEFPAMPDGGIQVKTTKEMGQILISEIVSGDRTTLVKYRVLGI